MLLLQDTTVLLFMIHLSTLVSRSVVASRRLIVSGHTADPDRFPYHTRIDYDGESWCGGTLIRRDFVLTAAHCVFWDDLGLLTATVGAFNHQNTSNTRLVNRILHHPTYHEESDINDIALLQIEPVDSDSIIVELNSDRTKPAVGDSVTVIGMGREQRS